MKKKSLYLALDGWPTRDQRIHSAYQQGEQIVECLFTHTHSHTHVLNAHFLRLFHSLHRNQQGNMDLILCSSPLRRETVGRTQPATMFNKRTHRLFCFLLLLAVVTRQKTENNQDASCIKNYRRKRRRWRENHHLSQTTFWFVFYSSFSSSTSLFSCIRSCVPFCLYVWNLYVPNERIVFSLHSRLRARMRGRLDPVDLSRFAIGNHYECFEHSTIG